MPPKRPVLSFERETVIAQLASRVARIHAVDGRTEPEAVARAEGLGFRYESYPENFDGALIHDAGEFYIVCNDRLFRRGSPRARFTFAHELGHYFLTDHREAIASGQWPAHYSRVEFASTDRREVEADTFAANLLLPEAEFMSRYRAAAGTGLERVARLAEHFGTSLTATAFRALGFGLFPAPAALLRWDSVGTLAVRRLSSRTVTLGAEYLRLTSMPPANSLTERMIANLGVGAALGLGHVMDWFPDLSGYGPGDQVTVIEEVKSVGSYGWLTLIQGNS